MGLAKSLNAARRNTHAGSLARTLAATLVVAAAVTCGVGYRAAATAAAASKAAIVIDARQFGAVGNGSHNDASAIQRAVNKAATRPGSTVLLPRGVYYCPTQIRLSSHVNLRGAGSAASWLEGRLEFGSFSKISKLKIGRTGVCALTNRPGARHTSISGCRFHGGGSSPGVNGAVVYLGGPQGNVSGVLFTHCQIERTAYVPRAGLDAYAKGVGNTITINEFCNLPHRGHVEHITFRDCHLGASNGHATGALRMMMEAYTYDNRTGHVYHGWKDLNFEGCTVEASDTTGLDFADRIVPATGEHSAHGVLITGCTFLGARKNETYGHGGLPIVYECPTGIVIRNNHFYASPHGDIGGSHVQGVTDAPALLIEGNTFDMTRSPVGLKHVTGEPCVELVGFRSTVVNNTFTYDTGLGVVIEGDESAAADNTVQGNTFTDQRASGGEPTIELTDQKGLGCHDNHITGNTITNRAAGGAGVIAQTSGGPNFAHGNTIYCGSALPFVVLSGKLVHGGNGVHP